MYLPHARKYIVICFISVLLIIVTSCDSNDNSGSVGTIAKIGKLNGIIASHIKSLENLKPYKGGSDSPVILDGILVNELSDSERAGLLATYKTGYCITILDPTNAQVAELHNIIESGLLPGSLSGLETLAYTICKEATFVGRSIHATNPDLFDDQEDSFINAAALVVEDLLLPPEQSILATFRQNEDDTPINIANLEPAFTHLMSVTSNDGVYNSTITAWGVYTCDKIDIGDSLNCMNNPTNLDQYFITQEADWTPGSYWQSGNSVKLEGSFCTNDYRWVPTTWTKNSKKYCEGERFTYCSFVNYPSNYVVEMAPLNRSNGSVFQINAAPSSTPGKVESYTSGFSFNITGSINVKGPGIIASATWDNETTTTVPALEVKAGNTGNEGASWSFEYNPPFVEAGPGSEENSCTGGGDINALKDPQIGQTPEGKFSNAIQTVQWYACPSRASDGFEVNVSFTVNMASSTMYVWFYEAECVSPGGGNCKFTAFGNTFCECDASIFRNTHTVSYQGIIPYPPTDCN